VVVRADGEVFFGAAGEARSHQEAVGGYGQRGVMVRAAPVTPLVMTKSGFLFQFLVVALDAPAQLDQADQRFLQERVQPLAEQQGRQGRTDAQGD